MTIIPARPRSAFDELFYMGVNRLFCTPAARWKKGAS